MTPTLLRLAGIALLALTGATPGRADSLASSASSAGSASVGSLSTSLTGSSNASSPTTAATAGDYRVAAVDELADRPGMLRLQLQATGRPDVDGRLWLTLPRQALARRALGVGDVVNARQRPYGLEFAHAADGTRESEAFFLVLADDWLDELAPRAVTL